MHVGGGGGRSSRELASCPNFTADERSSQRYTPVADGHFGRGVDRAMLRAMVACRTPVEGDSAPSLLRRAGGSNIIRNSVTEHVVKVCIPSLTP